MTNEEKLEFDRKCYNAYYGLQMGTDPEIFVQTRRTILPAHNFLPSKDAVSKEGTWNGPIFWDGLQAEFRTKPEYCIAFLIDHLHYTLEELAKKAKAANPLATLSPKTVVKAPVMWLKKAEPQFVRLGCKPSQNLYGIEGEIPEDGRTLPIRFAGGHIHFGFQNPYHDTAMSEDAVNKGINACDAFLGIWSVGAAVKYDNPVRRKHYGLAGEFRRPPHGVEYRTLSNFWLYHPSLASATLGFARMSFSAGVAGLRNYLKVSDREIVEIINKSDVKGARRILAANEDLFKIMFKRTYCEWGQQSANAAFKAGMEGIGSVLKMGPIAKNWKFGQVWKNHGGNMDWYRVTKCVIA